MDRLKVEAVQQELAALGCVLDIDPQGTRLYLKTPSGKVLDMEIQCEFAEGCAAKLKERVEPLPVVQEENN